MNSPAPTRPLPSPSSSSTPTRPNSNDTRRPQGSSIRTTSSRDTETSRKERERDKTSEILNGKTNQGQSIPTAPGIQINDQPETSAEWGANFWVTIEDPTTHVIFYACPSTGEASWEPPTETFLMPLSNDGHWWELSDDARGGISYYYHTKTGETQWTRPDGFVIPLGIIQSTTTLGRRLSQNTFGKSGQEKRPPSTSSVSGTLDRQPSSSRRTRSYTDSDRITEENEPSTEPTSQPTPKSRRSLSNDFSTSPPPAKNSRIIVQPTILSTIPGSPDATSVESSPGRRHRAGSTHQSAVSKGNSSPKPLKPSPLPLSISTESTSSPIVRTTSAPQATTPNPAQSFSGVAEMLQRAFSSNVVTGDPPPSPTPLMATPKRPITPPKPRVWFPQRSPANRTGKDTTTSQSPTRPIPAIPGESSTGSGLQPRPRRDTAVSAVSTGSVKDISSPISDPDAAAEMNPIKNRHGKPIFVDMNAANLPTTRLSTGDHLTLPRDLAEDIQKFLVEDFAKRYFSTHRTGVLIRRRVPVERMMSWQKPPLTAPLLVLNRSLHKDAVKAFKVIQRIMGDRDREKPIGVRVAPEPMPSATASNSSTTSLVTQKDPNSILEEERWMLSEGLAHGELRDEIYCQVVKQLSNNPNTESIFHGWQILCVLLVTFPPSKNLEAYLRSFIRDRLTHTEGRIDIMAKYCVHRLVAICKKGPRGKPPTSQEIENAADAAFNPSTFGESLESIFRLQQRTYPDGKVPIILPFLADSIIALGGTKKEGIFRVPGDADVISDLKVRIDKGHYNLQGIDDPHVPASLLKLWLRELTDPLIPADMYNDCISCAEDPDQVVAMVKKLPTINRRVLLFVISFLQLFLPEHVSSLTKMISPNLALVMAPNLLRCNSDSIAVVFHNARFEHIFVHNLLVHLKCGKIDPDYVPIHGLGAGSASGNSINRPKASRPRTAA